MPHSGTKGILFANQAEASKFLDDVLRVLNVRVNGRHLWVKRRHRGTNHRK